MTAYELRHKVAEVAKSYIGAHESDGSHKPIIDLYNQIRPLPGGYRMSYTDPWCAAFVAVVSFLCGLLKILFPECSCARMVELYKRAGRWVEDDNYLPNVGDVVFYDWQDSGKGDNTGEPDHVGIVVAVHSSSFDVVEGNYSDAVKRRTIARNAQHIRGFGVPDYDAAADEVIITGPCEQTPKAPAASDTNSGAAEDGKIELPVLRIGAVSETVRAAQILLIGRGCSCGPDGADAEFGSNTRGAVLQYQTGRGLTVDGEIGVQTWSSLLGLK